MKKIYEITKCLSGNVLGIGVDNIITKNLELNDRVLECNLLDSESIISGSKGKNKQKRLKKIKITKLRKKFKKKKVDFILCNVEHIKKYTKTFIKDSIYINKDMLYIYNINDQDLLEELEKKYKRYNTTIEIIKDKETTILKIDNKNSKTNIFKDIIYFIIDSFLQIINIISDILVN